MNTKELQNPQSLNEISLDVLKLIRDTGVGTFQQIRVLAKLAIFFRETAETNEQNNKS